MSYLSAFGALSPEMERAVIDELPKCKSELSYQCIKTKERINDPECTPFRNTNLAFQVEPDATRELQRAVPYCDYSKSYVIKVSAITAGFSVIVAGIVGIYIGMRKSP